MNVFTLSVLLVFGILLTYYGFLNVSVSCAPNNINDITQKYNNTYAIKVLPNTDSPDQIQIVKDSVFFLGSREPHEITNNGNELLLYVFFNPRVD